jgi:hypothetical protein
MNTEAGRRAAQRARAARRERMIRSGDLVSNAPLRARCEWLLRYDPEFSVAGACARMVDAGYPKFVKRSTGSRGDRWVADTSHFLRVLGMKDRAPSLKDGRRYAAPSRTEWIPYELAVAVARSLHMDPVDAGV